MKSKIRILVTHQVHLLSHADQIIVLDNVKYFPDGSLKLFQFSVCYFQKGEVQAKGHFQELLKGEHMEFSNLMKNFGTHRKDSVYSNHSETESLLRPPSTSVSDSKLAINEKPESENVNEKQATGSVKLSVYGSFARFGLGYFAPILVLFLFVLSEACTISSDYWLSYWYVNPIDYSST
jgi:hypothetical protein